MASSPQFFINPIVLHGPMQMISNISNPAFLPFIALDHVQLAMPPGEENNARAFYCGVLGMKEISKPPELAKRGGCWFVSGKVQIHLGVEEEFRPARKAHPALRCSDFETLTLRLKESGVAIAMDTNIPDTTRCHIQDCFGNRIELIKAT